MLNPASLQKDDPDTGYTLRGDQGDDDLLSGIHVDKLF